METLKNKQGKIIGYRASITINNKRIRETFKKKTDAKTWKASKIQEKEKNKLWGITTVNKNFDEYAFEWMQNKKLNNLSGRSIDSYKSVLDKYLMPFFKSKSLRSFKLKDGQDLQLYLKEKELSPSRVNYILRVINSILNDAVKLDYLIKNPFINLSKLKVVEREKNYWSIEEISKFLDSNKDHEFYNLYIVAINTGLRRGELLGLLWDKVDFDQGFINVSRTRDRYGLKDTTKSGKSRIVPMTEATKKALLELKEFNFRDDYVFTHRDGRLPDLTHFSTRIFKKSIQRAQLKDIRFHDLRTSFASNFAESGGDIYLLSKLLGHSSVNMTTKHYAHLSPEFLKKSKESLKFLNSAHS